MSQLTELIYKFLMSKTGQKMAGKRFRRFCERVGEPIEKTLAEDVFLVGYPKSGTTWFQVLTAGVVFGSDFAMAPMPLIEKMIPLVDNDEYYFRFQTPSYLRAHLLPRPEFRKVVYLVRDGRDSMVSLSHYNEHFRDGKNKVDILEMIKTGRGLYPCRWEDHVKAWQANPYKAEILWLRYEDLLEAPIEPLNKLAAFLGVKRDADELQRIVDLSSLDRLKAKEAAGQMPRKNWAKDGAFFRRGKAGGFRDEMTPEAIQAFQEKAGAVLKEMGYPLV